MSSRTSIISKAADVVASGRESEERRLDRVCVLALVDTTAPQTMVAPVRDAFDPRLPTGEVRVVGMGPGIDYAYPNLPDVCVVLCGSNEAGINEGAGIMAMLGVPVAIIAESALDIPTLTIGPEAAKKVTALTATNDQVLLERLAEWLIDATDKGVAFAANFPFCRRAKVRELVRDYAVENAMVTAKMTPGSTLPMMAVNQARLALSIAAINGQPLAMKRIPEVLSAVGAGFGSRFVANQAGGYFPLLGWVVKAGFGFLGTEATALALQARFDRQDRESTEALADRPESPSQVAVRAARTVARRFRKREGTSIKAAPGVDVRLLPAPEGEDRGYLVYEQEGVR